MERLLFGDNQFFGVNHMSEEKARQQSMRFQRLDAIMAVLDYAYASGIRAFMCTTHERVAEVVGKVREDPARYAGFEFYPCMPYAHKYANAVTEYGMLGALRNFVPDSSLVGTALRGGSAVAKKDVDALIRMLVDAEMSMFRGVSTPVVFLQNVVVDLLLGLGFHEAYATFAAHVTDKYAAEPGFITMNTPRLLDALDTVGVKNPIVCSNINKIGFRMSGGIDAYTETLRDREFRPIAMSVYASGAIEPREALTWIAQLPRVHSVVFGASTAGHIEATCAIARDLDLLSSTPAAVG